MAVAELAAFVLLGVPALLFALGWIVKKTFSTPGWVGRPADPERQDDHTGQ